MIDSVDAWASAADPLLVDGDPAKTSGAILPPTAKESQTWNVPRGLGWEKRFFTTPLFFDDTSKDHKHSSTLSGIP